MRLVFSTTILVIGLAFVLALTVKRLKDKRDRQKVGEWYVDIDDFQRATHVGLSKQVGDGTLSHQALAKINHSEPEYEKLLMRATTDAKERMFYLNLNDPAKED